MKRLLLFLLIAACSIDARSQSSVSTADMLRKYPNENSVFTTRREHLFLSFEDGKLTAHTEVNYEQLLLTDVAPSIYNESSVYHGFFNSLKDLTASTLIPDNDRYRRVKATDMKTKHSESDNVFYDDAKETQIIFGSLEKGARKVISYTLDHRDLHFLPGFYFQSYLPVEESVFEVTVPKSVNLKYITWGEHTDWIKVNKEEKRKEVTYTFRATNLPAMRAFSDAPSLSYYAPHIAVYISSYTDPNTDKEVRMGGTVDDLYHYYYSFIRNINTKEDQKLADLAVEITKGAKTPYDKAEKIYHWVQQNMKYIAFEDGMGGFVPREATLVCDRRFGDCKDMTSIQVALCRLAGIDAHFTWIGSRNIPYNYESMPLPMTDDHMICAAKIDGRWIFMDGTDTEIPFDHVPYNLQGKEALIGIDSTHFELVKIPEVNSSENPSVDSTFITLTDRSLKGNISLNVHGYGAWRMSAILKYSGTERGIKYLEGILNRGSNKFSATNIKYMMLDSTGAKDMRVTSTYDLPDYASKAGKDYFVNLNLQRQTLTGFVDTADRKVSFEEDYKDQAKEVVVLEVPKGYHVSYVPPDASLSVPGLTSFRITYKNLGKKVILEKVLIVETLYIQPAQFAQLNQFLTSLNKQYKESVVLTADK